MGFVCATDSSSSSVLIQIHVRQEALREEGVGWPSCRKAGARRSARWARTGGRLRAEGTDGVLPHHRLAARGVWVSIFHPYLGERRVANQDRRMPAEERKPSVWKADGRLFEAKKAGRNAQPSSMYMCSGAGNGTRTRDPLLGKIVPAPLNLCEPQRPCSARLDPLSPRRQAPCLQLMLPYACVCENLSYLCQRLLTYHPLASRSATPAVAPAIPAYGGEDDPPAESAASGGSATPPTAAAGPA